MIWSKQSVLLAVSLAAMVPPMAPRSTPNTRPAAGDSHQAAVGTALTASDALARAQAACEIGHGGPASATQVSQLVRLLADDTRVETPDCGHRGWGNTFGAEPVVCLSSPAQEAARALGRIGRMAVTPLLTALADPASTVRRHAAVALGLLDDHLAAAPAVPRLVATLTDADWQVRRDVVWALGETGGQAVLAPVSRTLADAHPRVRATAAHALGEIDDVRAVDALIGALKDEDPEVRAMVAWALGEISSADAVDGLARALRDEHVRVREMASWALGEIESPRAVDALVGALKDPSWEVRAKAAWALGEIGDSRASDPLAASMKDTHAQVRKMAAWALAEALGK